MPYLIDGHNLIPKITGLSLNEVDDEIRLIELLQIFCQRKRKKVEIFFDKALPGQPRARNFGAVLAYFVRAGQTADAAIQARLRQLDRAKPNWTVISSDHSVQAAAHAAKAHVLSSEAFARLLSQTLKEAHSPTPTENETPLSPDEVNEWLRIFKSKPDEP